MDSRIITIIFVTIDSLESTRQEMSTRGSGITLKSVGSGKSQSCESTVEMSVSTTKIVILKLCWSRNRLPSSRTGIRCPNP